MVLLVGHEKGSSGEPGQGGLTSPATQLKTVHVDEAPFKELGLYGCETTSRYGETDDCEV